MNVPFVTEIVLMSHNLSSPGQGDPQHKSMFLHIDLENKGVLPSPSLSPLSLAVTLSNGSLKTFLVVGLHIGSSWETEILHPFVTPKQGSGHMFL